VEGDCSHLAAQWLQQRVGVPKCKEPASYVKCNNVNFWLAEISNCLKINRQNALRRLVQTFWRITDQLRDFPRDRQAPKILLLEVDKMIEFRFVVSQQTECDCVTLQHARAKCVFFSHTHTHTHTHTHRAAAS
jgi:hypothetical protein